MLYAAVKQVVNVHVEPVKSEMKKEKKIISFYAINVNDDVVFVRVCACVKLSDWNSTATIAIRKRSSNIVYGQQKSNNWVRNRNWKFSTIFTLKNNSNSIESLLSFYRLETDTTDDRITAVSIYFCEIEYSFWQFVRFLSFGRVTEIKDFHRFVSWRRFCWHFNRLFFFCFLPFSMNNFWFSSQSLRRWKQIK